MMPMRLAALLLLVLPGCPRVCENAQTRCSPGFVEVCTSKGRWLRFADCKAVRGADGVTRPGECRASTSGKTHICGAKKISTSSSSTGGQP